MYILTLCNIHVVYVYTPHHIYVYRLGRNGSHELTQHPWLRATDWAGLRTQKAPYIPAVGLILLYYRVYNNAYVYVTCVCMCMCMCTYVLCVVGFVGDV